MLCTLQLWDFGGQKKFRFLLNNFIRGADGALLLFDLTSMRSFLKLDNWVRIIRKITKEIPIILIGSKYDLVEEPIIKDERALEFKETHKLINYVKTSSKSGYHIEKAFDELMLAVRNEQDLAEKEN
jgi:small GTP-binding protein